MDVIKINQVSKTFGRGRKAVTAVDGFDLAVEAGQVFGFLGPNGAGKSTTIRMILDLIRPSRGTIELFGVDVQRNPSGIRRTGALVEGAVFYPFLSGRENLSVLAHTAQLVDRERIDLLLSQVGMESRADKKVSGYSTGMKQRLGIAAALLSDPELVILDEPTNGLDPGGIIEMRKFIRSLATDQGKTVFLSSHLLNEVEAICDRVAIIQQGRLLHEGKVKDLLSGSVTELRLETGQPDRAVSVLQENWKVERMEAAGWVKAAIQPAESPGIVRMLVENSIDVHQAVISRQSLEEFFLSVTGEEAGRV